jgi:hypothetical protein
MQANLKLSFTKEESKRDESEDAAISTLNTLNSTMNYNLVGY